MFSAQGFAVASAGVYDVNTVSETRRAAIVNWLVLRARCQIDRNTTDHMIEKMWDRHRWPGVDVHPVFVSEGK